MTKKKIRAEEVLPVVVVNNNRIFANSLNVAEVFEKDHNHVLRDIQNLGVPQEFRQLNFGQSNYTNKQGKQQPMVNITRDGFTLLAMGFTGPKAMKFKLAYIEAFNKMEEELRHQQEEASRARIAPEPDPARLAESLMQALITALSGKHNDKIDDLGCELVTRLQTITDQMAAMPGQGGIPPQLEDLNNSVAHMRKQLTNMLPKLAVPDNLLNDLRIVAQRLNTIADQQDDRDFSFHERLRSLELQVRATDDFAKVSLTRRAPGLLDFVEGNLPESLCYKFNEKRIPKAAGTTMVLRFMNKCLVPDPEGRIETEQLYRVYCAWCFANLHTPLRITSFKQLIRDFAYNFHDMIVRTENYVQYLYGAKVQIPQESDTQAKGTETIKGRTEPEGRAKR